MNNLFKLVIISSLFMQNDNETLPINWTFNYNSAKFESAALSSIINNRILIN